MNDSINPASLLCKECGLRDWQLIRKQNDSGVWQNEQESRQIFTQMEVCHQATEKHHFGPKIVLAQNILILKTFWRHTPSPS